LQIPQRIIYSLRAPCRIWERLQLVTDFRRRTARCHKKIKRVYFSQGYGDLHKPLKDIPRAGLFFSVAFRNIKRKIKKSPATLLFWTVKSSTLAVMGSKMLYLKKFVNIDNLTLFLLAQVRILSRQYLEEA